MRLLEWARNKLGALSGRGQAEPYSTPCEMLIRLAQWQAGEPVPEPQPDAAARVEALESRYAVRIPGDFRRYLVEAAPAAETTDDEFTTWWPPERVRNIPDEYKHGSSSGEIAAEANSYLFFADYMIWCWAWAVCCSDGPNRGRVAFIGGEPDGFVADSFSDFVERYLADPRAMANTMPQRKGEA